MLTKTTIATLACLNLKFQIGVLQTTPELSNICKSADENRQYSGPVLRKCAPPILMTVLFHSVLSLSLSLLITLSFITKPGKTIGCKISSGILLLDHY